MRNAIAIFVLLVAVSAAAETIAPGDLAGVSAISEFPQPAPHILSLFSRTGTFKFTSNFGGALAFAPGDRLYVTDGANTIDAYDSSLTKTQITTSSPLFPISIAAFANGDLLAVTSTKLYILSAAGVVKQSFAIAGLVSSAAWQALDLAPDQCTAFYIDVAGGGHRFNVCSGVQLADLPAGPWNGVRAFADGGYLAASGATLKIFDAGDHLVRTLAPQIDAVTAMVYDVDPRFLWVATAQDLARINLSTGDVVFSGRSALVAIAVNGEQRPASAQAAVQDIPSLSPPLLFGLALALIALAWQRLRA